MKSQMRVYGSGDGGKDSSGGGGISESADTVSSVATASFVDLIGEGRIKGLVNNEHSIYLDGIPLRDLTGTPNYRPFRWVFTPGTQDQEVIPGFAGTQQENAVNVPLTFTAGKIIRPIIDADTDAVRVTVSVNSLSETSTDGKVGTASVAYKISVRQSGGAWVIAFNGKMTEKTSSRFQRSHTVPVADLGVGPYEVAVERVSPDSTSALLVNYLNWDSFTVINYEQYAYPNSALVGVGIDARYFSQVPERSYHVQGLLVRVPSNYNAERREYTGVWDGNFITSYTNNPAWCLFDILTHPRYGCGSRVADAMANKWAFYTIGKYCDEAVPTGIDIAGRSTPTFTPSFNSSGKTVVGIPIRQVDMEPRFTLNVVINQREDAYKVLNNLASVFRGMIYWSAGQVTMSQDSPAEPQVLWTNANVIGGVFNSEGSSRAQRHTVALIGWNDPTENFKQKFEYVEDREGIIRYGVRPAEMVAFGCTSRSQARRVGLWLLYTEKTEKDAITFSVGLDSSLVTPGMIGQVMDNKRVGARWGGRLLAATTTHVTLDSALTLAAGTYTLSTIAADGSVVIKSITLATNTVSSEFTVSTPFATAPGTMSIWTLASSVVVPRLVRVVSVKQKGAAQFDITALTHNPSKFAAIERGDKLDHPNYSFLSYDKVPDIVNLVAVENSYTVPTTGLTSTSLDISWDQIDAPLVRGYRIKLVAASGGIQNRPEQSACTLSVLGLPPDTYTVYVRAVNLFGILGSESQVTLALVGIDTTEPDDVSGFSYTVVRGVVQMVWNTISDLSYAGTELHIEGSWSPGTTPLFKGAANSYNWTLPTSGTFTILAKHYDRSGNYSVTAASLSVTATTVVIAETAIMKLSKDSISLPADLGGTIVSYSEANTDIRVELGGVDDTPNWTLSATYGSGTTGFITGTRLTVTNISSDTGSITVKAVRSGYSDQIKVLSLSKARSATVVAGPTNMAIFAAPPSADSSLRFNTDGTVEVLPPVGSPYFLGNWYLPTTAGIGAGYWLKLVVASRTGGTAGSLAATTSGTEQMNVDQYISLFSATPGLTEDVELAYTLSTTSATSGLPVVAGGTINLKLRT